MAIDTKADLLRKLSNFTQAVAATRYQHKPPAEGEPPREETENERADKAFEALLTGLVTTVADTHEMVLNMAQRQGIR